MNNTLSRKEARRTIDAVQRARKAGGKAPGEVIRRGDQAAIIMAAQAMKASPETIRHRIGKGGPCERLYGLTVDWSIGQAPQKKKEAEAPVVAVDHKRIVALQDENAELKRQLKNALRDELDTEAIRQILGGITAAPVSPPNWVLNTHKAHPKDPEVPVTIWSDWHGGEKVSPSETNGVNSFDLETLERRVRRLVDRTIMLCRDHGPGNYPGIVINLLGDMCSGGLHPELAKTDEEEIIPSALRVRDLLVWSLDRMIEYFGNIYCPCTSGNHGRATQKPEFKRYVFKNFDWLIYQLLSRHYEGRKEIVFDIPDSNEVLYRVYNQRHLAMHGDMLGVKGGDGIIGAIGPIMRGEIKVGKQSSAIGRDYDVLIMGHWHQPLWLPRIIVNGSLKGWDEYVQKALRAPPLPPSQQLWFIHPKWGRTAAREVLLEDPVVDPNPAWVSYLGAVA